MQKTQQIYMYMHMQIMKTLICFTRKTVPNNNPSLHHLCTTDNLHHDRHKLMSNFFQCGLNFLTVNSSPKSTLCSPMSNHKYYKNSNSFRDVLHREKCTVDNTLRIRSQDGIKYFQEERKIKQ